MKLAIFGATGRTGIPLVKQALEAGHEVIVLVRTPGKLNIQNEHLQVIQGDAMNAGDVDKVVKGADAVISVLGQSKESPRDMQTVATENIVRAMNSYGVKRLISLTGAGVDAPQDKPKAINYLIKFALKTLSGHVLKDAEGHAAVIRNSTLDWTIVRGPRLNEDAHTGVYRVGWVGVNSGINISRADLADFMLKQLSDTSYLRQAPMISY
jgi:putative NADH-flavin reductase